MTMISCAIKPEEWFPKYCHISIELNGDFEIADPFKNVKCNPSARSIKIMISPSFDGFGKSNATKYLREVIQCVGSDIEWMTIEMNANLATEYLHTCATILQNVSALAIQITGDKSNLKSYQLDQECLKLKTLSLHNCSQFITNIGNWPKLENLSIVEESELKYEPEITEFITKNKQLKSLHIDSQEMRLNRIANAFDDCSYELQELRIHNVHLSFEQHYHKLTKLRNISRLEVYNLQIPNSEAETEATPKKLLRDFVFCLASIKTLIHLTFSLNCNLERFNCSPFSKLLQLQTLSVSAYHLDPEHIAFLVKYLRELTILHLHTYDGFSDALIQNIAQCREKSMLKDQKLNLFVGGRHDNLVQVIVIASLYCFCY